MKTISMTRHLTKENIMRSDKASFLTPLPSLSILALAVLCVFGYLTSVGFGADTPQKKSEAAKPSAAGKVEPAYKFEGSFEISVQFRDTRGDRVAKFQEYRDIPRGFVLDSAKFKITKENSPFYLDFSTRKSVYRDQEYQLNFGVFGKYKSKFSFNEIPHFFNDRNTFVLTQTGPGVYSLNNTVRTALQAADDPTTIDIVNNLIANAPALDLKLKREQTKFSQEFTPRGSRYWTLFYDLDHERRKGNRITSAGTYVRRTNSLGDQFDVIGIDLPEPINYRTVDFTVGSTYARERGFFIAQYDGSFFRNRVNALRWANPFRSTDALADPPGGGTGRGKFASGQMALYPDNDSQSFTFGGGIHLPWSTEIKSSLSYVRLTQDSAFLPYTVNTAILATPSTTPAVSLGLPRSSLDGRVDVTRFNLDLVTKPWNPLTLTARYGFYNYNDKTDDILFPGYAAFGESWWLTAIAGEPIERINKPYFRQRASLEASLQATKSLILKADYDYEGWNRTRRNVTRNNDNKVGGSLIWNANDWTALRLAYHRALRRSVGGYRPFREAALMRAFDQADRDQNTASVGLDLTPNDKLSFSLSYQYYGDDYKNSPLGLKSFIGFTYSADASYHPTDKWTWFAGYSRDSYRAEHNEIAKVGAPIAATFDLRDLWTRNSRDYVDTFGTGLTFKSPESRWEFDFSYNLSLAKGKINTFSLLPNPPAVLNATAFPFPDTEAKLHDAKLSLGYKFRPNLTLGARYWFEPFTYTNFADDVLSPYLVNSIAPENNAVRYLFMNSKLTSYHANVAAVFLRYDF